MYHLLFDDLLLYLRALARNGADNVHHFHGLIVFFKENLGHYWSDIDSSSG